MSNTLRSVRENIVVKSSERWALLCTIVLACQPGLYAQQLTLNGPIREIAASEGHIEAQPAAEPADDLQAKRKNIAEMMRIAQQALDSAKEASREEPSRSAKIAST